MRDARRAVRAWALSSVEVRRPDQDPGQDPGRDPGTAGSHPQRQGKNQAQSQAFPRGHRLLTGADYQKAFTEGFRISDPSFTLILRGNGLGINRLGLAVAKRQIARATRRNRVKRAVREAFRIHCRTPSGLDLVVLARTPSAAEAPPILVARICSLWRRVPGRLKRQGETAPPAPGV